MSSTNYASLFGIQNKWAPILFAILYFIIFWVYVFKCIRNRSAIYLVLGFFCLIRITAFSLRAVLANEHKEQTNQGVGVAYAVLYNIGFFGMLLSAYNLLHNRAKLANANNKLRRAAVIFHARWLIHLLVTIAVILGIVGLVIGLQGTNPTAGSSLSHTAIYLFLAVAIIILLLTPVLVHLERSVRNMVGGGPMLGANHQHLILFLVALLLLARTLFFAATAHQRKTGTNAQTNEHFWFPLAALTELLVVLLILVPGLVPLRLAMENRHGNNPGIGEKYPAQTGAGTRNAGGAGYGNGTANSNNVV